MKYSTRYERLVANTRLAIEDDPTSCWLWTGTLSGGYPKMCERNKDGQPRNVWAHRAMLEEVHDVWFPFDEAGHLCGNPSCINPGHLEIQTRAHNMAEQRSQFGGAPWINHDKSWIPVLFPRHDDSEIPF